MGQSEENNPQDNMYTQVICISLLALAASAQKPTHNLPVLFQYEEPGHSVAVFRGVQLKQAIAAGLVPGFGNLGRGGKKIDTNAADMTATKAATAARAAADARAKAAADARAASAARAAAARPSKLEL